MEGLYADVRAALRHLRSAPFHALAVVFSVGLGVAVVTAVFTAVDAVLLRPLPYADVDRLVMLYETNPERGWDRAEVAPANFLDWREDGRAFADITAFQDWLVDATLSADGEARTVQTLGVFGNFFDVLGARPQRGRTFRVEESWEGADDVVVLSARAWQREFGGDPAILGQRIMLDGRPRTVIGVMSPDFREPPVVWSSPSALAPAADAFIPFGWTPAEVSSETFFRQAHTVQAIGRLRPAGTLESARNALANVASRLEDAYPATNRAMGVGAVPLRAWVVEDGRTPLLLLLGAAGFVLLLTCANVANLMLARATGRLREMAVRSALGASGARLARQVLVDSVLLGALGGAAGLIIAAWTTDALIAGAPPDLPRLEEAALNLRAFGFAAAVSLACAIGFGLAPALAAARPDPELTMRGGRATESRERRRVSALLVMLQVALAITILSGAGLLFRTFRALRAVDPGFDAANVLTFQIATPVARYPQLESSRAFFRALEDRLRTLPGVTDVAMVSRLPLTGGWTSDASIEGMTGSPIRNVRHREVSPGYFEAIGTPLLAGREVAPADRADAPLVAVVNRAFAERYLAGVDPVGRRVAFDAEPGPESVWRTIVGVVDNTRGDGLRAVPDPEVYGALAVEGGRSATFVVRSPVPPLSLVEAVRGVLGELDAELPLREVRTLADVVTNALSRERFLFALMSVFALLATLLAAIGVYGTTAHAVRRRTPEIGVRMALGADRGDVARWVLSHAMRPVLSGALLGLAGALPAGWLLRGVLFGVGAADPATLFAVVVTLLAVPLAAALIPARRAARTDPLRVLREEG